VSPSPPATDYSEDALVEQPASELFGKLAWKTANVYHETFGPSGTLGRETDQEVVLTRHLRAAIEKLNRDVPPAAFSLAIEELTRDRSTMSAANANREIYHMLKDGVKVKFRADDGSESTESVRIIDWREPANNEFFLTSQLWVSGDMYQRRCDLVGLVNGIPLVFVELKASHKRLENAVASAPGAPGV